MYYASSQGLKCSPVPMTHSAPTCSPLSPSCLLCPNRSQLSCMHSENGAEEMSSLPWRDGLQGQQGCECSGMRKAPCLGFISCPELFGPSVKSAALTAVSLLQVSPGATPGATPSLTPNWAGRDGKATKLPANCSTVLPGTQILRVLWL